MQLECTCAEYNRYHREYIALESAQRAGAKNGREVVRLTDECGDKGIVLVPGGETTADPKCPVHAPWTQEQLEALRAVFDTTLAVLPELTPEQKMHALWVLTGNRWPEPPAHPSPSPVVLPEVGVVVLGESGLFDENYPRQFRRATEIGWEYWDGFCWAAFSSPDRWAPLPSWVEMSERNP